MTIREICALTGFFVVLILFFFKDAIMLLPYVKEFLYFTGSD